MEKLYRKLFLMRRFFLILEGVIGYLVEYYIMNYDFKFLFEEVEFF